MAKDWEFTSYTKTYHRENSANSAKGKVVVVTGGGSGIGKGIAEAFVLAGAKAVAIVGRRQNVLDETKRELEAAGSSTIVAVSADVSDATGLSETFAIIKEQVGSLDVVVANAASVKFGPIATAEIDDWWSGFEFNLKGTFLTYRAFTANSSTESPIFISLNTGFSHVPPVPGVSSYAVSKIGSAHLVSYLAKENPSVRAVSFHPGVIATSDLAQASAEANGFSSDEMSLPAGYAVWLASPRADWTNGRLLWAHWDVEELEAKKDQILKDDEFTIGLKGFPRQAFFEGKAS